MVSLRAREFSFLRDEIEDWLREGIITDEQSSLIMGRYEVRSGSAARWLLNFGAVLIGLGIISFIAANWPAIPRFLRAAGIIALYIAAMTCAFRCGGKNGFAGSALTLAGALVYGAGIFLVGQMFNYSGTWTDALDWWILGLLPAAFAFADEPLMMTVQMLSLVCVSERALRPAGYPAVQSEIVPLALIAALWIAGAVIKRRAVLGLNVIISLAFIFMRTLVRTEMISCALLIMAACGGVLSLMPRLLKTCGCDIPIWGMFTLNSSLFALTLPSLWEGSRLTFGASPQAASYVSAAVLAVLLLLEIVLIKSKLGRLFAVLLTARYFLFYAFGFMPRAIVFTIAGALCVFFALRVRKAALRGGRSETADRAEQRSPQPVKRFSRPAISPLKYALCAAAPLCVLVYMAALPAAILAFGTEITLSARPVDPRDLMMGDYVTLALDIERQTAALLPDNASGGGEREFFALLRRDDDGFFTAEGVTSEEPASAAAPYLRFEVRPRYAGKAMIDAGVRVDFGAELSRFYVPENTGRELESAGRLAVRANVLRGRAVFKEVKKYGH